jgi:molybdate transport system permease protein
LALGLLAAPLVAFLLLPEVGLAARLRAGALASALADETLHQAVSLSLATTSATLGLAILAGTPLSYVLARRKSGVWRWIDLLVDLPTVLPPAVAGLGLLYALGRRGLFGSWLSAWGIEVAFTPLAVILAQSFVSIPYFLRTAALGLASVDTELEMAAALDGASGPRVFWHVSLPLAWRSFAGGAALCWARAMGEFGATIIFAGSFPGRTQTMTLAVYLGLERDLDVATALGVLLLLLSFLMLFLLRVLLRERP